MQNALEVPKVQLFFEAIVDPIIQLMFAAAVFYFVFGVFTYIRKSDDSAERLNGANHILWSTIGLFIMISVWGIITFLENSIGQLR